MAELEIADPLQGNATLGYLYLFISVDGNLRPDADNWLVNYEFNLTTINETTGSNEYFDAYKMHCDEGQQVIY